jgi:3-isopropylmalate dehydrogenase
MTDQQTLLLLPGDGIGPEVIAQVKRVIDTLKPDLAATLHVQEHLFGGACYDVHHLPITAETIIAAQNAQAVLMGAVGGPQWSQVSRSLRPEAGLLALRKAMDVYANLRPAICFGPLAGASALKPDVIEGLDIVFVRELTGGVYFGEPRGIDTLPDGSKKGYDTQVYTTAEIERVARVAFELARTRSNHVTSLDKANVMESGLLWRQVVTELHARDYPDVRLVHQYADNAAMQMVRAPKQFDVLLTDNLFGDVLSDLAAACTGSIGLLPSAALSSEGRPGLYEPIHGSAPDIAGQNLANPLAAILSLEMALRLSLNEATAADRLRNAVETAIANGARTRDLGGDLTTAQMGDKVIAALNSD